MARSRGKSKRRDWRTVLFWIISLVIVLAMVLSSVVFLLAK